MKNRKLTVLCAVTMIIWGVWIGNPWWATFPSSTAYDWMARLAPEYLWGWGIGLLGLCQLVVALRSRHESLHIAAAIGGMFVWFLIAVAFGLGNWRSTAVIVYSFVAAVQALIYIDDLILLQRHRNGWVT